MTQEEITEFAKLLVQRVRDSAIVSADGVLTTENMNSPIARHWRVARESGDFDKFGKSIIVECVDNAIFYFLLAIDEGLINLSFKTLNDKRVELTDEIIGELGGYYMAEWRSEYSSQRLS